MKTTKIELSKEKQDWLFDQLTERFDISSSVIYSNQGEEINFPLNELIEVWATLGLDHETMLPDENNQSITLCRGVNRFHLQFVNHEGSEVDCKDFDIDDRISKYYTI